MPLTPSFPGLRDATREFLGHPEGRRQTLWMEVRGYSMFPTLRPDDRVEVEGVAPGELRFGDLAVLETPQAGWVIHRFFGLRRGSPPGMWTKGDASPRFDPACAEVKLLGRVRLVERSGRRRSCHRAWLLWGALRSLLVWIRGRLSGPPGQSGR